jgi:hypothetical protein
MSPNTTEIDAAIRRIAEVERLLKQDLPRGTGIKIGKAEKAHLEDVKVSGFETGIDIDEVKIVSMFRTEVDGGRVRETLSKLYEIEAALQEARLGNDTTGRVRGGMMWLRDSAREIYDVLIVSDLFRRILRFG